MAKFSVNASRFDPYRNFKFRIKWDGQYVAGMNKCSVLKKPTEVVSWFEAGDQGGAHKMPGKTSYDAITLQAGVTHDTAFEDWANLVNNYKGDAAMSLAKFRKDFIVIDIFNLQGVQALSYVVHRCWVSEYQALPELDAGGNAVMIQTIKLENEGWERDVSVKEPQET
jgi:phage tail-like protein